MAAARRVKASMKEGGNNCWRMQRTCNVPSALLCGDRLANARAACRQDEERQQKKHRGGVATTSV